MIEMFSWRITKYNPKNRDSSGNYLDKEEWTSYFDINNTISNKAYTYQQYLSIEDAYIVSIIMFMKCNKVKTLCVVALEKSHTLLEDDSYASKEMKQAYETIKNGAACDISTIAIIARLILRERIWCKFEAKSMFVHFGWDYYMYISSARACNQSIQKIKALGLYVEEYASPYLDEE